jgi:DNA-binding beta-propeller fold protein YncE
MFPQRPRAKCSLAVLLRGLLVLCVVSSPTAAWEQTFALSAETAPSPTLSFVRAFSSADDVRPEHPILDRTLNIIAGPADLEVRVDALQSPSAVASDSSHRIFVADPGATTVHIFDFVHSKYDHLDRRGDRLHTPISLAEDGHDNLYVLDQSSRSVLVYDSTGKFRRRLGKLRGGESHFDDPSGIAVDKSARRIYVCDRQGHMIYVMDERGKLVRKLGNRGGGTGPGEFRFPTGIAIAGNEIFVLDTGNKRIQVLDKSGHFLRALDLAYADRRTGLAVDSQGSIYVSDSSLDQIQVLGREGLKRYTFDLSSVKDANFSHPSAMWVDAGRSLYVVDSQHNRVGIFRINEANATP